MKKASFYKSFLCILLCLTMLIPLAGCGESRMEQSQIFAMNTTMTLTAFGKKATAGLRAAEGVIQSMHNMLDPNLPTSTAYAINNAVGENVVVPAQVAKMLTTAATVYKQSGGALDLSIYPLVKRWGFEDAKYYLPSDEEIYSDKLRLAYDQMTLTSFPSTGGYAVSFPAGTEISFAAVAKGCASENAIDAMRQVGVESGIISLGGNIQTLGTKPDGSLWTVGIQDPNNLASYLGVISVGETAVVTSAAYQCGFTQKGRTYHHLLSPVTGYPVNNTLLSATVICEDGTMADALSTALYILGENRAINYWRTYGGFEMILVTNDNRIVCTKGLIDNFTQTVDSYKLSFTE